MEKQNKAARQRRKKEEMARIRTLVGTTSSMAVVCPRVQVGCQSTGEADHVQLKS